MGEYAGTWEWKYCTLTHLPCKLVIVALTAYVSDLHASIRKICSLAQSVCNCVYVIVVYVSIRKILQSVSFTLYVNGAYASIKYKENIAICIIHCV